MAEAAFKTTPMNRRFPGWKARASMLAVVVGLLVVTVLRSSKDLGNGYRLTRVNGSWVILGPIVGVPSTAEDLADPISVVVTPSITRIFRADTIVAGFVKWDPHEPASYLGEVGLFVLDTTTGELQTGMIEAAWSAWLLDRGKDPARMKMRDPSLLNLP